MNQIGQKMGIDELSTPPHDINNACKRKRNDHRRDKETNQKTIRKPQSSHVKPLPPSNNILHQRPGFRISKKQTFI